MTHPAGPHHDALLARHYPEGFIDGLGANERQRRLGEMARRTVTGKFWGASKPREDYTFTTGPVGWVAMATPLVVHNHPALAQLGNAFSDGANLWVHGPWLEQHAADKANEATVLVDWLHLCLHEMAQRAAGKQPEDPMLPLVSKEQLVAALPQQAQTTWSTPGDARPLRQALALARHWDIGAMASDWAPLLTQGSLEGLTVAGTPLWRSWAELFTEAVPEPDEVTPAMIEATVLGQVQRNANKDLSEGWTHTVIHALMTLQRHDGDWKEGRNVQTLLEVVRATRLGTNSFYAVPNSNRQIAAWIPPPLQKHDFFGAELEEAVKDTYAYFLDGVQVSARDHRPVPLAYGEGMFHLSQACALASLKTGQQVSDPVALGNAHTPAWLYHGLLNENKTGLEELVSVWLESIKGKPEPLLHPPHTTLQDVEFKASSFAAYVAQQDKEQCLRLIEAGCRTDGLDAGRLFWECLTPEGLQDQSVRLPLLAWVEHNHPEAGLCNGEWSAYKVAHTIAFDKGYPEGAAGVKYLRTQHGVSAQLLLEATLLRPSDRNHAPFLLEWFTSLLRDGSNADLPSPSLHCTPREFARREGWKLACLNEAESRAAAERLNASWPQATTPNKPPRM